MLQNLKIGRVEKLKLFKAARGISMKASFWLKRRMEQYDSSMASVWLHILKAFQCIWKHLTIHWRLCLTQNLKKWLKNYTQQADCMLDKDEDRQPFFPVESPLIEFFTCSALHEKIAVKIQSIFRKHMTWQKMCCDKEYKPCKSESDPHLSISILSQAGELSTADESTASLSVRWFAWFIDMLHFGSKK